MFNHNLIRRSNRNAYTGGVGHPVADAGVLDATGDAGISGGAEFIFYGFQCSAHTGSALEYLTC